MRYSWFLALLMALFMGVTFAGCPDDTQDDIEDAAEDAGDEVEDAGEDVKDAAENAVD